MIAVTPAVLILVLSVIGLHPAAFSGRVTAWPQVPPNIRTSDDLRLVIEELLARSPTLRAQCARIAIARHTYVSVTLGVRISSQTRARSTARKYQSGLLVVDVEIPPASQDFAELLAHELEHVTEFIDGIDFKKLVRDHHAGVVQCGVDGSFETERAQKAGRAVKLELESAPVSTPATSSRTSSPSPFGVSPSLRRW